MTATDPGIEIATDPGIATAIVTATVGTGGRRPTHQMPEEERETSRRLSDLKFGEMTQTGHLPLSTNQTSSGIALSNKTLEVKARTEEGASVEVSMKKGALEVVEGPAMVLRVVVLKTNAISVSAEGLRAPSTVVRATLEGTAKAGAPLVAVVVLQIRTKVPDHLSTATVLEAAWEVIREEISTTGDKIPRGETSMEGGPARGVGLSPLGGLSLLEIKVTIEERGEDPAMTAAVSSSSATVEDHMATKEEEEEMDSGEAEGDPLEAANSISRYPPRVRIKVRDCFFFLPEKIIAM